MVPSDSEDVCPMDDAIVAFLEYLVEPKLPAATSGGKVTPSLAEQESVAKQVHAVVILYNYYLRKQQPRLEFLSFEGFCKLSVHLKPTMVTYLKHMEESGDIVLDDLEKHLSLAEKMVMDACDISAALDASKDNPDMQGWPISKVAVFLLDSKKKYCFLQFGTAADGTWSMIEKVVDFSGHHIEGNMDSDEPANKKRRIIRKSLKDDPCDETTYRNLAYVAVKNATGLTEDCLKVLECHVAYSISKVKAAACLYIIQCTKPDRDGLFQVPIEDTLNSMLGPLVMRSSGRWTHTSVVEYFHILPYHKLLLDWLSRKVPYSSFTVKNLAAPVVKADVLCGLKSSTSNLKCLDRKTKFGSPDGKEQSGNVMDVSSINRNDNARRRAEHTSRGIGGFMVSSSVGKTQHSSLLIPYTRHSGHQDLSSSYQDGRPTNTSHLNDLDKVLDVVASKGREISEAAHRVLLGKRDKLSLQHRVLEDQIAQCDRDIEAVLRGGEDCLALQIQSILEGCNDASFRSVLRGSIYGSVQDQDTDQPNQGPCQVLDSICLQNDWSLPTYRMSVRDGGFKADVAVKGRNFKHSADGSKQNDPVTARESAAEKMLTILRQNN